MKLINASFLVLAARSLAQEAATEPAAEPALPGRGPAGEPAAEPAAEPNQDDATKYDGSTVGETAYTSGRDGRDFIDGADDDTILSIIDASCHGNEKCLELMEGLKNPTIRNSEEGGILRKLKQLKVLILWLQPEHRFARYCFYGCWCLPDREHKLFTVGYGKPVDNVDASCQRQSKCYECAAMDHAGRNCDPSDTGYGFRLHYDPLNPSDNTKKSIECTDEHSKGGKHSCKRSICECDKKLSEDLREHFSEWYEGHHQEQGAFDAGSNCLVEGCKSGNCGAHTVKCCGNLGSGIRMPYKTDGRRMCCGDRTYDSTFQECCDGNVLAAIGTC